MLKEENIIKCFKITMNKIGISDSFYSLEGYKEGASCMEKQADKWFVFDAERAEKYLLEEYPDIIDACLEVIHRFTYSEEDFIYLSNIFQHNLSKMKRAEKRISASPVKAPHYTAKTDIKRKHMQQNRITAHANKRSGKTVGRAKRSAMSRSSVRRKGFL